VWSEFGKCFKSFSTVAYPHSCLLFADASTRLAELVKAKDLRYLEILWRFLRVGSIPSPSTNFFVFRLGSALACHKTARLNSGAF
jgi:hypothetical protein